MKEWCLNNSGYVVLIIFFICETLRDISGAIFGHAAEPFINIVIGK